MFAVEASPPVIEIDTSRFQQALIDTVKALDFAGLVISQRGPVEMRLAGDLLAEAAGIIEGAMKMRGVGVKLLGYTADIHAGAAQV